MPDNVIPFPARAPAVLEAPSVERALFDSHALVFTFSRPVTDEEMALLHRTLQRACSCLPQGGPPEPA